MLQIPPDYFVLSAVVILLLAHLLGGCCFFRSITSEYLAARVLPWPHPDL